MWEYRRGLTLLLLIIEKDKFVGYVVNSILFYLFVIMYMYTEYTLMTKSLQIHQMIHLELAATQAMATKLSFKKNDLF